MEKRTRITSKTLGTPAVLVPGLAPISQIHDRYSSRRWEGHRNLQIILGSDLSFRGVNYLVHIGLARVVKTQIPVLVLPESNNMGLSRDLWIFAKPVR